MAKTTEAKRGKFAFQCKNCGHLELAEAAGENALPGACSACRHGVRFESGPDGTGFTIVHEPENWIVLADLSDAELKKGHASHGLTKADVAEPKKRAGEHPKEGARHTRQVSEKVGSKDRG